MDTLYVFMSVFVELFDLSIRCYPKHREKGKENECNMHALDVKVQV